VLAPKRSQKEETATLPAGARGDRRGVLRAFPLTFEIDRYKMSENVKKEN